MSTVNMKESIKSEREIGSISLCSSEAKIHKYQVI